MATILVLVAVMTVIVATTITLIVLSTKDKRKNGDKYNKKLDCAETIFTVFAGFMIAFVLAMSITCMVTSTANNQYDVLESRYEQLKNTYDFYNIRKYSNTSGIDSWLEEVYDYNNKVLELKVEAGNKWTNWFVNANRINELKYIEFVDGYPVFE